MDDLIFQTEMLLSNQRKQREVFNAQRASISLLSQPKNPSATQQQSTLEKTVEVDKTVFEVDKNDKFTKQKYSNKTVLPISKRPINDTKQFDSSSSSDLEISNQVAHDDAAEAANSAGDVIVQKQRATMNTQQKPPVQPLNLKQHNVAALNAPNTVSSIASQSHSHGVVRQHSAMQQIEQLLNDADGNQDDDADADIYDENEEDCVTNVTSLSPTGRKTLRTPKHIIEDLPSPVEVAEALQIHPSRNTKNNDNHQYNDNHHNDNKHHQQSFAPHNQHSDLPNGSLSRKLHSDVQSEVGAQSQPNSVSNTEMFRCQSATAHPRQHQSGASRPPGNEPEKLSESQRPATELSLANNNTRGGPAATAYSEENKMELAMQLVMKEKECDQTIEVQQRLLSELERELRSLNEKIRVEVEKLNKLNEMKFQIRQGRLRIFSNLSNQLSEAIELQNARSSESLVALQNAGDAASFDAYFEDELEIDEQCEELQFENNELNCRQSDANDCDDGDGNNYNDYEKIDKEITENCVTNFGDRTTRNILDKVLSEELSLNKKTSKKQRKTNKHHHMNKLVNRAHSSNYHDASHQQQSNSNEEIDQSGKPSSDSEVEQQQLDQADNEADMSHLPKTIDDVLSPPGQLRVGSKTSSSRIKAKNRRKTTVEDSKSRTSSAESSESDSFRSNSPIDANTEDIETCRAVEFSQNSSTFHFDKASDGQYNNAWDSERSRFKQTKNTDEIACLAFSNPDLAVASKSGALKIFEAKNSKLVKSLYETGEPYQQGIVHLQWINCGQKPVDDYLLVVFQTGKCSIFHRKSWTEVYTTDTNCPVIQALQIEAAHSFASSSTNTEDAARDVPVRTFLLLQNDTVMCLEMRFRSCSTSGDSDAAATKLFQHPIRMFVFREFARKRHSATNNNRVAAKVALALGQTLFNGSNCLVLLLANQHVELFDVITAKKCCHVKIELSSVSNGQATNLVGSILASTAADHLQIIPMAMFACARQHPSKSPFPLLLFSSNLNKMFSLNIIKGKLRETFDFSSENNKQQRHTTATRVCPVYRQDLIVVGFENGAIQIFKIKQNKLITSEIYAVLPESNDDVKITQLIVNPVYTPKNSEQQRLRTLPHGETVSLWCGKPNGTIKKIEIPFENKKWSCKFADCPFVFVSWNDLSYHFCRNHMLESSDFEQDHVLCKWIVSSQEHYARGGGGVSNQKLCNFRMKVPLSLQQLENHLKTHLISR